MLHQLVSIPRCGLKFMGYSVLLPCLEFPECQCGYDSEIPERHSIVFFRTMAHLFLVAMPGAPTCSPSSSTLASPLTGPARRLGSDQSAGTSPQRPRSAQRPVAAVTGRRWISLHGWMPVASLGRHEWKNGHTIINNDNMKVT